MQNLGMVAWNNATFIMTLDFSQVAALYPSLSGWTIRMQVKTYTTDAIPLYEWVTGGAGQGLVTFNSATLTAAFTAPQSGIAGIVGQKYFDIRVESPTGEFIVAVGQITFQAGVTGSSSGPNASTGGSLGDTVACVFSQTMSSPAVPPLSISYFNSVLAQMASDVSTVSAALAAIGPAASAAVSSVQAAQTTAVAAVVAAASSYQTFTQAEFIAWLNARPTTLPSSSGQWWLDQSSGGVGLVRS